jgi:hypothetical protein
MRYIETSTHSRGALHHRIASCLTLLITLVFIMQVPVSALDPETAEKAQKRLSNAYKNISFSEEASCVGASGDQLPSTIPAAWVDVLTKAAASHKTSAKLLAAIYLTENGNEWRPFDYKWSSSPHGAIGPFQFLPGTWDGHRADGDGDGKMDVMDVWDAAFAAADMIADIGATPTTPLGDLQKPMTRDTLLYVAVAYNAGPGFAERSDPSMTLEGLDAATGKTEAKEYAMNVHALISSDFTKKGKPAYPDPKSVMSSEETPTTASNTGGCFNAVGAAAIVEMGLKLAWPDRGHGKEFSDARGNPGPYTATEAENLESGRYKFAMPKYDGSDKDGGDVWSDCGVFVATVVHATKSDPDYPKRGTYNQLPYMQSGKSKTLRIVPESEIRSTADLRPGDILLFSAEPYGHTYIYTGKVAGLQGNGVSASFHGHVPQATGTDLFQKEPNGVTYRFSVIRLK